MLSREALQEDREGRLHTSLDEEMYKAKRRRYGEKIWCKNGGSDGYNSYLSPTGYLRDQALLGLEWLANMHIHTHTHARTHTHTHTHTRMRAHACTHTHTTDAICVSYTGCFSLNGRQRLEARQNALHSQSNSHTHAHTPFSF